jgi:hypothetical protein
MRLIDSFTTLLSKGTRSGALAVWCQDVSLCVKDPNDAR